MAKQCFVCNTEIDEGAEKCPICGCPSKHFVSKEPIEQVHDTPELITCPACNKQVSNQAPSCPHCGQPIDTRPKCPTCGSPDIKKMSHIKKSASIWFWGLTSDKINKTWECNKCGQTW